MYLFFYGCVPHNDDFVLMNHAMVPCNPTTTQLRETRHPPYELMASTCCAVLQDVPWNSDRPSAMILSRLSLATVRICNHCSQETVASESTDGTNEEDARCRT
jgi:hypothetical protein